MFLLVDMYATPIFYLFLHAAGIHTHTHTHNEFKQYYLLTYNYPVR